MATNSVHIPRCRLSSSWGKESPIEPRHVSRRLYHRSAYRQQAQTSAIPPDDVLEHLDTLTQALLDGRSFPLGTMHYESWEGALQAVDLWLSQTPRTGFHVDCADRIVQRLVREAVAILQPNHAPILAMMEVARAWMDLAEQHPYSLLAVQRAQDSWDLTNRYHGGTTEQSATLEDYTRLVQIWLYYRGNPPLGLDRALRLLLSDQVLRFVDCDNNTTIPDALIECFHDIRELAREHESFHLFTERMTFLQEKPGWEALKRPSLSVASSKGDTAVGSDLSPFEAKQLLTALAAQINDAGPKDHESIIRIMNELDFKVCEPESLTLAQRAILDYFIRCGQLQVATSWIDRCHRFDNTENNTYNVQEHFQALISLLRGWNEHHPDDPQTPWKTDELLRQIEGLAQQDPEKMVVPSDLYSIAAKRWSGNELSATNSRKVLDLLDRAPSPDGSIVCMAIKATNKAEPKDAIRLLDLFKIHFDSMPLEERDELIKLAFTLSENQIESRQAVPLLKHFLAKQALTKETADFIVETLSRRGTRVGLLGVLENLQRHGLSPRTETLLSALRNFPQRRTSPMEIDSMKKIAIFLIKAVKNGVIEATTSDLDAAVRSVCTLLKSCNKSEAIMPFFTEAEAFLPNGHTLETYKAVMSIMLSQRHYSDVQKLFNDLQSKKKEGKTGLVPDEDCYYMMMSSYRLNPTLVVVKKQQELLEELLDTYYSTGSNEAFKPSDRIFLRVMKGFASFWSRHGTVARMMGLLNLYESLEIKPANISMYSTAMISVIQSKHADCFPLVMKLKDNIQRRGLEPDDVTHRCIMAAGAFSQKGHFADAITSIMTSLVALRSMGKIVRLDYMTAIDGFMVTTKGNAASMKMLAETLLKLAERDGCLDAQIKDKFENWVGTQIWKEIYNPGNSG